MYNKYSKFVGSYLTMTLKLTYESMLYLALGIVSIFIIYKLFKINTEEGFQSIINKFKNNKDKDKNKDNKKGKIKKTGNGSNVSFDDLVAESEAMDPSKYTVDKIKNNFFDV